MNVLFDKVFFRLWVVYDNLLKSSKTLKEIKTYFIYINNRHKVTRKTREKEKIQKIDRAVRFHTLKQFVLFFLDRFIRFSFSFLFIVSSTIVNKKILTKTFILIIMSKITLQQTVRNRRSELLKWTILIQYLTMISIQCTSSMN